MQQRIVFLNGLLMNENVFRVTENKLKSNYNIKCYNLSFYPSKQYCTDIRDYYLKNIEKIISYGEKIILIAYSRGCLFTPMIRDLYGESINRIIHISPRYLFNREDRIKCVFLKNYLNKESIPWDIFINNCFERKYYEQYSDYFIRPYDELGDKISNDIDYLIKSIDSFSTYQEYYKFEHSIIWGTDDINNYDISNNGAFFVKGDHFSVANEYSLISKIIMSAKI